MINPKKEKLGYIIVTLLTPFSLFNFSVIKLMLKMNLIISMTAEDAYVVLSNQCLGLLSFNPCFANNHTIIRIDYRAYAAPLNLK